MSKARGLALLDGETNVRVKSRFYLAFSREESFSKIFLNIGALAARWLYFWVGNLLMLTKLVTFYDLDHNFSHTIDFCQRAAGAPMYNSKYN